MRSPADAAVIDRERDLPALRDLLDPEAFARVLRSLCPDREIGSVEARYLRYKPQTSCLIAFLVSVDGVPARVYARCHRDDQAVKLENARSGWEVDGPLGPGLLIDERRSIAVFSFPNDYEVRALRKLYEPDRTPVRMRRVLPAHPHLHGVTPEPLSYKPERRFVGLCRAERGPSAVVRLYPDAYFAEVRERADAFRDVDGLRTPRVVGQTSRYNSIACEWVEGQPLHHHLREGGGGASAIERLGRALPQIHRQRPRIRAMTSREDYCRSLTGARFAIETSDPSLGERAERIAERVREALSAVTWRTHAVHGDLTCDQIIVGPDGLHLIDLDRVSYGDPRMDLGAFVAGLTLLGLGGVIDETTSASLGAALCDAYWSAGGVGDAQSLRPFVAAALLLMAPEPFRYRQADWPDLTAAILETSEGVLAGACVDA